MEDSKNPTIMSKKMFINNIIYNTTFGGISDEIDEAKDKLDEIIFSLSYNYFNNLHEAIVDNNDYYEHNFLSNKIEDNILLLEIGNVNFAFSKHHICKMIFSDNNEFNVQLAIYNNEYNDVVFSIEDEDEVLIKEMELAETKYNYRKNKIVELLKTIDKENDIALLRKIFEDKNYTCFNKTEFEDSDIEGKEFGDKLSKITENGKQIESLKELIESGKYMKVE